MTTSSEICKITGALPAQVNYWIRCGHLRGGVERVGRRNVRFLPDEEGPIAVRLGHLVVAGISPSIAAIAARAMVRRGEDSVRLSHSVTVTVYGA